MEWIDADKYWPSNGTGVTGDVIVDGWTYVSLDDKYDLNPVHGGGISVCIKFFCIIPDGETRTDFCIKKAHIYEFDGFCCNYDEANIQKHKDYLRKIECYPFNFREFAHPECGLTSDWDTVTRWQYLIAEESK